MGRIAVLPEVVANRIAAGEVIERPASVAKELIENSLDAGATEVEIRVEGGGTRLVQVSDNGSGIEEEDIRLAFERHATSKIRSAEEISRVLSFGFRGEALPSVASVSEVEMVSAAEGGDGKRVLLEGGRLLKEEKAHRTRGTTAAVRNLFYNTPARRKFLKSAEAEERWIRRAVIAHALAQLSVSFRYLREGDEVFHLPSGEDLLLRVSRLFGRPFAEQMIPIEGREMGPVVTGLVSKVEAARGNRSYQYFHVNGRPVEQSLLVQAATTPFREYLPPRRYPALVISLTIDPSFVDINIHPTKREVRFSPERTIFASIEAPVRRAIRSEKSLPPLWEKGGERKGGAAPRGPSEVRLPLGKESEWTYHRSAEEETAERNLFEEIDPSTLRPVGDTFLVGAGRDLLLIVDKHAAHERILFEEAMDRMEEGKGESQKLLFPETVAVDPVLISVAEEYSEWIEKAGFLVRPIGPRSLMIEGVPPGIRSGEPAGFLIDFLDHLQDEGKKESSRKRGVAASLACHGAIRSGDALTGEEMKNLLARLARARQPFRCPHGRPTVLTLTTEELRHRFLRT